MKGFRIERKRKRPIDRDFEIMAIRLSIVVPVYNVERFLDKCVESLLDQDIDHSEYEIILVDDGSSDNSSRICDDYANHGNIHVIHQPNGGLSVARNTGILAAKGHYIQFVDSDDCLQCQILGPLLERAEGEDLDVLRFGYQYINEDGSIVHPYKEEKVDVDMREDIVDGSMFLGKRLGTACYACQFMVKTAFLRRNELRFTPGILFEDVVWTPAVLLAAEKVSSSVTVVYNYLIRDNSITKNKGKDHLGRVLDSYSFVIKQLAESKRRTGHEWFDRMIAFTCVSYMNTVALDMYDERRDRIRKLMSLHVLPIKNRMASESGRRKLRLINISPTLYCFLLHLKHI